MVLAVAMHQVITGRWHNLSSAWRRRFSVFSDLKIASFLRGDLSIGSYTAFQQYVTLYEDAPDCSSDLEENLEEKSKYIHMTIYIYRFVRDDTSYDFRR